MTLPYKRYRQELLRCYGRTTTALYLPRGNPVHQCPSETQTTISLSGPFSRRLDPVKNYFCGERRTQDSGVSPSRPWCPFDLRLDLSLCL